jgi:release factor glutamine methyltransferase
MTYRGLLEAARRELLDAGIPDAPLEAELLLRRVTNTGRAEFLALPDKQITAAQQSLLEELLARRLNREPAAYILGHREFYGLEFTVDPRVLIPRPETELLVEEALAWCRGRGAVTLADIGTGSGAVAVSLAVNLPDALIYAADVSETALEVTAANCRRHGVTPRVKLLRGDLLEPLPGPVDLIAANLPYVTEAEMAALPPEISRYEPRTALSGGADGLDLLNRLCDGAPAYLNPGACLLLEMSPAQTRPVAAHLRRLFPAAEVSVLPDLAGLARVVRLRR